MTDNSDDLEVNGNVRIKNIKGETLNTDVLTWNKTDKKMKTIHLTKEDFLKKVANFETNPTEWKYLGDKPCIIDFYADWCGPCRRLAPVLETLSDKMAGKAKIVKVNVERQADIADAYKIRSLPTIVIVKH
ncbi:MAG: thioredoxin domain-containing protein, partial [Chitinophagales bacterium]|nr:thioredoxin domain-containing protein [Chitinophagales bacterium]